MQRETVTSLAFLSLGTRQTHDEESQTHHSNPPSREKPIDRQRERETDGATAGQRRLREDTEKTERRHRKTRTEALRGTVRDREDQEQGSTQSWKTETDTNGKRRQPRERNTRAHPRPEAQTYFLV